MRPKSTPSDLPSSYDVSVHIHNQFVKHMKELKEEIQVSSSVSHNIKVTLPRTWEGSTGEGIHNCRWMVSGYDQDGVYGHDRALD